jgi:hypothetical protein
MAGWPPPAVFGDIAKIAAMSDLALREWETKYSEWIEKRQMKTTDKELHEEGASLKQLPKIKMNDELKRKIREMNRDINIFDLFDKGPSKSLSWQGQLWKNSLETFILLSTQARQRDGLENVQTESAAVLK